MAQISDFFVDPASLPDTFAGFCQLLTLLFAYAYVLFVGSNYISDGSELLLLVPSLAGIVGSVVLPVLGAVPDAAIVLFSGLGPDAQEQLSVGVGALAGSTIMLLTMPWVLSVFAGRVSLDDKGACRYKKSPKLIPPMLSLTKTGVEVADSVRVSAALMVVTALSYLIIQGPAFFITSTDDAVIAKQESIWAAIGLAVCLLFFCGYLKWQWDLAHKGPEHEHTHLDHAADEARRRAVLNGKITFSALFYDEFKPYAPKLVEAYEKRMGETFQERVQNSPVRSSGIKGFFTGKQEKNTEVTKLLAKEDGKSGDKLSRSRSNDELMGVLPSKVLVRFEYFLRGFFYKYDKDRSGSIDKQELSNLIRDMNDSVKPDLLEQLFSAFDADNDGQISFDEFVSGAAQLVIAKGDLVDVWGSGGGGGGDRGEERKEGEGGAGGGAQEGGEEEDEDEESEEEEEEMPEDIRELSPEEQQAVLIRRSFMTMGLGTAVVLLFSDPMVDVLSELGVRIGVSPFYVAFVLAPLASNASELLASYNYALKKTSKTISVSMAALAGAACMNNTFCLAVFMLLVLVKGLAWEFSAETISILFVEVAMALFVLKKVHTLLDGVLIASLYPISLVLVASMEAAGMN